MLYCQLCCYLPLLGTQKSKGCHFWANKNQSEVVSNVTDQTNQNKSYSKLEPPLYNNKNSFTKKLSQVTLVVELSWHNYLCKGESLNWHKIQNTLRSHEELLMG